MPPTLSVPSMPHFGLKTRKSVRWTPHHRRLLQARLQAEAGVASPSVCLLNGGAKYLFAAAGVWDYSRQNLVARLHGECFWRDTEDGWHNAKLWKIRECKGPNHVSRACLVTLRRLAGGRARSSRTKTVT